MEDSQGLIYTALIRRLSEPSLLPQMDDFPCHPQATVACTVVFYQPNGTLVGAPVSLCMAMCCDELKLIIQGRVCHSGCQ